MTRKDMRDFDWFIFLYIMQDSVLSPNSGSLGKKKHKNPYEYTRLFHFRYLIAFKNLLRSIESLGIASVEGINYFGRGRLFGDNYINYVRHEALGRDLLNAALTYVPSLKKFYGELTRTMPEYGKIKAR